MIIPLCQPAFPSFMTKKRLFASPKALDALIAQYFEYIEGEYQLVQQEAKSTGGKIKKTEEKVWLREPEPPTLTGLALYLGFNSKQEFEACETKARYGAPLKRARLRIESIYEKKLHFHSSSGAVFALKSMGWNERTDDKVTGDETDNTLKVEIIQSGIKPASSEKEVVM